MTRTPSAGRPLKDTVHRNLWKRLATVIVFVVCFLAAKDATETDFGEAIANMGQAADFFSNLLSPDWAYFAKVWMPLVQTIRMSVVGTSLGLLFGVPFAFLCTSNVTGNRVVATVARVVMDIIRTIPTLLLAALVVAFMGIGQVSGIITIAVFTFGIIGQLIYQSIEISDPGPVEAARSVGANRMQIATWSILPQIGQDIASYAMYAFEINIRASVILGYVGAGGVGVLLNSSLSLMRYDRVSLVILTVLALVVIVDWVSEIIRKRLR